MRPSNDMSLLTVLDEWGEDFDKPSVKGQEFTVYIHEGRKAPPMNSWPKA
jgi:hypothetical protein